MLATLQQLGVMPSVSRPACSNDNPFSESLFETMKYRPIYIHKPFDSLLNFVTSAQRHAGQDVALLSKRVGIYEAAKAKNPRCWSCTTRNWQPVAIVHLKPDKSTPKTVKTQEEIPQIKKAA